MVVLSMMSLMFVISSGFTSKSGVKKHCHVITTGIGPVIRLGLVTLPEEKLFFLVYHEVGGRAMTGKRKGGWQTN